MTTIDYSPFTPGLPVPIELFVGRNAEVKRLSEHVAAAAQGHFRVALLAGERGIGKTSLASYVKGIAEQQHNMVGVHVMLGGANTVNEMVRRTFEGLLHVSRDKKWYEGIKDFFGNSVKSADLFGLKLSFAPTDEQLIALSRNFGHSLKETIDKLASQNRAIGLTLILDNINGLAESQEFADWLKSTIDDIAINRPMSLCLVLVGIEERRRSLVELNPSLARSFDLFSIEPWKNDETREFYSEAFDSVGFKVNPDAMNFMVRYAGGLPAVAHEIGDATIRSGSDKIIDRADALRGVTQAARIVGQKHVHQQVIDAIRSTKYRAILQKLAESAPDSFFNLKIDRATLKNMLSDDESRILHNFIQRMKKLGAIEADDDEGPGHYKLTSYILAMYLYMEFSRPVPQP